MESRLMADSLELLVYGMGLVFAFLVVLVFATLLMSRLVARYFPEAEGPANGPSVGSPAVDPLTLKIIQAAVDRHRGRQPPGGVG